MLGVAPAGRGWAFSAQGKHPLVKDYLAIGQGSHLAGALATWVERGFSPLARVAGPHSWRFWARGGGKGELACGLLCASRDSIGRPYPLLILGQGPLPGWEGNWDLLTLALEPCWRQLEELARAQSGAVPELEGRLWGLEPPRVDWDGSRELVHALPRAAAPPAETRGKGDERLRLLPLDTPGDPQGELAARVARLFPASGTALPGLGFLGGAPGVYRYCLFLRALRGSDFSMLWDQRSVEAGTP